MQVDGTSHCLLGFQKKVLKMGLINRYLVTITDNGGDTKWLTNQKALLRRMRNRCARRTNKLLKALMKTNLLLKRMPSKFVNKTNNPNNKNSKINSNNLCYNGSALKRTRCY